MIVCITGLQCTGKTTLAKNLAAIPESPFRIIQTWTTRSKRPDEDDSHYRFNEKGSDIFGLCYAIVYAADVLYGVNPYPINLALDEGEFPVLIITPEGVSEICEQWPEEFVVQVHLHAHPDIRQARYTIRKKGLVNLRDANEEPLPQETKAHITLQYDTVEFSAELLSRLVFSEVQRVFNEQQTGAKLDEVYSKLTNELKRAESLWSAWPTDPIHAAAIIVEEVGELVKAIQDNKNKPKDCGKEDILKEAVQSGAMVLRFLKNFDKYDFKGGE